MAYKGLRDVPIEKIEDENLDIKPYVESLSQFIMECDTPMTIAIQGDWGSGKTSMMNLVRATIEARYPGKIYPIWFNTWQYSQFNAHDQLGIALLTRFSSAVSGKAGIATEVKELLFGLSKVAAKNVAFLGTMAMTGSAEGARDAQELLDQKFSKGFIESITELKDKIIGLTQARLDKSKADRIVVFIDDLDRLIPERAVELLEVFKLFLDVPGCVFVLACDYQVIAQGLKKKFDIGEHDLKGKSFFDKIIQLPFSMPISQYDTRGYTADLLNKIGVTPSTDGELDIYRNLIASSVGLNPRSMKRLFNSFQLITLAAEYKGILKDTDAAKRHERQRILLACLCLQTAFEPVYRHLAAKGGLIESDIGELREFDADNPGELMELAEEMGGSRGQMMRRWPAFANAFTSAIQLDSDDRDDLSEAELHNLAEMLAFASITSTAMAEGRIDDADTADAIALKKFLSELATEINDAHGTKLGKLRGRMSFDPKIGARKGLPFGRIESRLVCEGREITLSCWYRGRKKPPRAEIVLSGANDGWWQEFVEVNLKGTVGHADVDERGNFCAGQVTFSENEPLRARLQKFREMVDERIPALLTPLIQFGD